MKNTIDIRFKGEYPSNELSNFKERRFVFRGVHIASMEGFLQSLKFSNRDAQKNICKYVGFTAKMLGTSNNWYDTQTLWWDGQPISRESDEYIQLIEEAYMAMFEQCPEAVTALLDTGNAKLTHKVGKSNKKETILTEKEFCSILTKIRKKIRNRDAFVGLFT